MVITEVSQNHLEGRNDSDVTSLMIFFGGIRQIPQNIGEFFPNVEGLSVAFSEVETIGKQDFASIPLLRQLDLFSNRIQVINSDTFRGVPLLEGLSVYYNPIRRVGHTAFDNLSNLRSLHFGETGCIHQIVDDDRAGVEDLIFQLAVRCPPTMQMIEAEIIAGAKFQRTIDYQIADRINPITFQVYNMDRMLNNHQSRIEQLERQIWELTKVQK